MPTCRRKRVLLTEPSPVLLDALKRDPNRDVFYLAQTGELFETYESVQPFQSFRHVPISFLTTGPTLPECPSTG